LSEVIVRGVLGGKSGSKKKKQGGKRREAIRTPITAARSPNKKKGIAASRSLERDISIRAREGKTRNPKERNKKKKKKRYHLGKKRFYLLLSRKRGKRTQKSARPPFQTKKPEGEKRN